MIKLFAAVLILASLFGSVLQAQPNPKALKDVKKMAIRGGEWVSIATELRPLEDRTGTGKMGSFYVSRSFKYFEGDTFEGTIISSADPYGKMPLVKFTFKGHTKWGKPHPIAEGAFEIDYILDIAFEVTPLNQMFADQLNMAPAKGLNKWELNVTQNIKGKEFPLFGIKEGQIVGDYDLIYFNNGMLFMGAKHTDGRGFDKPENRPTNLQIPLIRKK